MVNINRLKGIIAEKGLTNEQLAREIGVNKSTFYRKINSGGRFSIAEAQKIAEVLGLSNVEAAGIFFAPYVA